MVTSLGLDNFDRARRKAVWRDWFSRLTGKDNDLLSFQQTRQDLPLKGQHYLGLQVVALDQILGSESRRHDFDRAFFPRQSRTRDRWLNIDQAYYQQVALPPVELVKLGHIYFVRDGNHRISVARAHGQDFIDAYVTEIEVTPKNNVKPTF
jgi:hypothetical protein